MQLIAHRNTPRSISIVCNIVDLDPIMTRPASRRLVHLIFSIGHRHHMMERFAVTTGGSVVFKTDPSQLPDDFALFAHETVSCNRAVNY